MATTIRSSYEKLCGKLKQIYQLNQACNVLVWDQQVNLSNGVYNDKTQEQRGEQLSTLQLIIHELETSKELGELISELQSNIQSNTHDLNEYERKNIALAKKSYDKKVKVPKELVEEESKLSIKGYTTWVDCKKNNDFASFQPILEQWLNLKTKMAKNIDSSKKPYDVLLDQYEQDTTQEFIETLFQNLKDQLVPFISAIEKAKKDTPIDINWLTGEEGTFDVKKQEQLNQEIAKAIGFKFENGILAVSAHPFTISMSPYDVRITTRYDSKECYQGVAGTVHECGHAMYEQNLNKEYLGLPVADAEGMGVHESQSLFWERHVGLSLQFFENHWSLFQNYFPQLKSRTAEEAYKAVNHVVANLIRVEDGEVTYPMHIVLRFEIERDLFAGKIQVKDMPQIWNAKMKEYLGIVPETDTKGVLQDVHFASGYFGYFPTYLIGAIIAAQLHHFATKQIPDFEIKMKEADYKPLQEWLRKNVHEKGSLYNANDLVKSICGEPISTTYFMDYLKSKYCKIYPTLKNYL